MALISFDGLNSSRIILNFECGVRVMVFNATFKNIFISWRSVLL